MWTVVYIAPNKANADMIKTRLEQEGVLVQLRSLGLASLDTNSVEIMVPEGEVHEAHEIIDSFTFMNSREG